MVWKALDIATKAKLSPLFHSDVFWFSSPFPSHSPLQIRRQHVPPLFYHPPTYCSSAHRVPALPINVFNPSPTPDWRFWHHTGAVGLSLWGWEGFITALLASAFRREFPQLQDFQLVEKSPSWHSAVTWIPFITHPFTAAHSFWNIPFLCGHIGVQALKLCPRQKSLSFSFH